MTPSAGSAIAAMNPPSGIAVWRTPSASPRSAAGNQYMTARPLAAFTLAPAAPAIPSSASSTPKRPACEAPTSAVAQPPSPAASTSRSPTRSASSPHGNSVSKPPIQTLSITNPTSTRLSPNSCRICGASTGNPIKTAE